MTQGQVLDRPGINAEEPSTPSRYRHAGFPDQLLGRRVTTLTGVVPDSAAGRPLIGLVQVGIIVALVAVGVARLRRRRYRLLGTVAGGAALAGLVMTGLDRLLGQALPAEISANLARDWLVGDAGFPSPAILAAAVAVAVVVGPWLTHSWRRAVWIATPTSSTAPTGSCA